MISPRNVELPPWYVNALHWGCKPVLSYSKPHTLSTSFGEEKERKNAFNLSNQPCFEFWDMRIQWRSTCRAKTRFLA